VVVDDHVHPTYDLGLGGRHLTQRWLGRASLNVGIVEALR
jgi:hypothetical protein